MFRRLPGYAATFVVAALLVTFIAVPLGAVLIESVSVSGPMSLPELKEMTTDALGKLDPAVRKKSMARWLKKPKTAHRIDAVAATLELIGEPVNWDRKDTFDSQIIAAEKAVEGLGAQARERFDAEDPVAMVMLHKRIPLAFKLKKQLSKDEFELLRTGAHQGYGLDRQRRVWSWPIAMSVSIPVVLSCGPEVYRVQ